MQNQTYIFFIFILNGILIGLLFDVFRVFRRSFKTTNFITYIEDAVFWIITGLIILYSVFKFNSGELRIYIFIGITLGALLYFLLFSKIFVTINVSIVTFMKKIIYFIVGSIIKYWVATFKILFIIPSKFLRKKLSFRKKKLKIKKDFS